MYIFGFLWENMKKVRVLYIIGLVLSAITSFAIIINPYLGGQMVDEVFQKGNVDKLLPLLLMMGVVQLTRTVLRYFMLLIFENSSQQMTLNLKQTLYTNLQKQDMRYFDNNRTGDIMAKLSGDTENVRHMIAWVIYNGFECIIMFLACVIYLGSINWWFTFSLLIFCPVIFIATRKMSKALRPMYTLVRDEYSRLNTAVQENISGNRIVKAFVREKFEIEKFQKCNDGFTDINVKTTNTWLKYIPIIDFCSQAMNVLVFLVGGLMVVYGKIELFEFTVFSSLVWMLSYPLRLISTVMNDAQRGIASADKIMTLYYAQSDIVDSENPIVKDKLCGNVKFENVTLTIDGTEILKNISFEAHAGETIAIMGPTGSGKTMLTNLLSRFYDVHGGSVKIDDVDVKHYALHTLRRNVAYAMQDVFLFSDTIEGNIAFAKPDMPMTDVEHFADLASISGFLREMPEGYDTIIGERGVGLSGGQKQRIALARALAAQTPILILDDTTSAVDMETERHIQHSLNSIEHVCTIFIIAQRISSVKNADKIIIIENGKISEMGTHDELLEKKGYYYDIFMLQHGEYYEGLKAGSYMEVAASGTK